MRPALLFPPLACEASVPVPRLRARAATAARMGACAVVAVVLAPPVARAGAPVVTLSVGDASVVEGDVAAEDVVLQFPLTLSGVTAEAVTVRYTTTQGTATAGVDYVQVTNALVTIPAGETSGFADVSIIEDLIVEPDETFTVTLIAPGNATLGVSTATGTILNDEDSVSISIGDAEVVEGDSPAEDVVLQFPLTLSGMSTDDVTVQYTTSAGTASANLDYVQVTNALVTLPAGEASGFADVAIVEDLLVEADETLTVTLSAPGNATIDVGTATGTILDDEDDVTISIGDASVLEGDGSPQHVLLELPLTLSGVPTKPVTVLYTTSPGTASADVDYLSMLDAPVTIAAGETSGVAVVEVVDDELRELDETLTVSLSEPENALLAVAAATGTILDDEDHQPIFGDGFESGDTSAWTVGLP